jgi:hypothetical protein
MPAAARRALNSPLLRISPHGRHAPPQPRTTTLTTRVGGLRAIGTDEGQGIGRGQRPPLARWADAVRADAPQPRPIADAVAITNKVRSGFVNKTDTPIRNLTSTAVN